MAGGVVVKGAGGSGKGGMSLDTTDPVTLFAMIVIGLLLLCCLSLALYFCLWKNWILPCIASCTCASCKPACRACSNTCGWGCCYPACVLVAALL